ncbi:MAG: nitroreductase family protein [Deltaproteobacteria bacterium]|nr:nitroreductase family protein [Deltaproteobacteria bacterium]
MEYSQLIKERYSVRKLDSRPVEESKLAAILEAARVAPTAVNKQPQRILVLRGEKNMQKLAACTPYTFNAPMALAVCCNRDEAWVRPFDNYNSGVIDASVVGTHIMLAVHDLGLGSTWVGHFDPAAFRKEFNLPDNIEPVVVFPIGYPAPEAKPAHLHEKRRPLEETVVYDSF